MPSLPAALKGCDFLITLEISSSEMDMGEGILAGYRVLGMSERLASGRGKKSRVFRASAFSGGVVACPEEVTRLGMDGVVGGRRLRVFTHFASGQMPFLPLAASATACL